MLHSIHPWSIVTESAIIRTTDNTEHFKASEKDEQHYDMEWWFMVNIDWMYAVVVLINTWWKIKKLNWINQCI